MRRASRHYHTIKSPKKDEDDPDDLDSDLPVFTDLEIQIHSDEALLKSSPEKPIPPSPYAIEEGTLKSLEPFDPRALAQELRKALKAISTRIFIFPSFIFFICLKLMKIILERCFKRILPFTDVDISTIVKTLTKTTCDQRQQILHMYRDQFETDLQVSIRKRINRKKILELIMALLMSHDDYCAMAIEAAIERDTVIDSVVIEILFTRNNDEICRICNSYEKLFKVSLESKMDSYGLTLFYKRLKYITQICREEDIPFDHDTIKADAQVLKTEDPENWEKEHSYFMKILTTYTLGHIHLVFKAFERLTGFEVSEVINKHVSEAVKRRLIAIAQCIEDRPKYFCNRLYHALLNKSERKTVMRIIITRCEIDMIQIKGNFEKLHGESIENFFRECSSDYYNKAIISLLTPH